MEEHENSNLPAPPANPDSHSLLDIVPERMVQYIEKIPEELFHMTETELEKVCYPKNKRTRKDHDNQLRLSFWNEYERALLVKRRMQVEFIYGQTMHENSFFKHVCRDPHRLAWIVCPPGDYVAKLTGILNEGIKRLDDIFKMPIQQKICRCHWQCVCKHPDGLSRKEAKEQGLPIQCVCRWDCKCPPKFDAKVADVILKALEKVEMRVKGAVIQKIDERRLQVNLFGKAPANRQNDDAVPELPTDMDDIERRIKELELVTKTPAIAPAPTRLDDSIPAEFSELPVSPEPEKA